MKRDPKIVFGEWVELGRDEGMATGHQSSVNHMLSLALKGRREFSFIDAGCGNGWVVRQVAEHPDCISVAGVDAAQQMIEKAKACDSKNYYVCADLERWSPNSSVDVVHSMEVVYYLNNPARFFQNVYKLWLRKNGMLIVGLDFYLENKASHSWPDDCGISIMRLFSENEWVNIFANAGFSNVVSYRFGAKEGWEGTLIISGNKLA